MRQGLELMILTREMQVCTVGNTWIEQCTVHPELLSMTIGGDW